ncbi:sensor histidine kinase [Puia dinghuensis]|uniref:Histidine kinase n=1 Tax=Puia dinghuensis TaxID=1792502 RepID=A0A8J2UDJ1_9BACT|nr:histidine kinase [Puia dinghuensis]GGB02696.1 histidine kinase [Puia dinghuensis]
MQKLPFIFSNERKYRLARHLVFWVVALFGMGLVGMGVRPLFSIEVSHGSINEHLLQPILYLPGQLVIVYALLYFVIPRYILHSRYPAGFLWIIILSILAGFIAAASYDLLFPSFDRYVMHRTEPTVVMGGIKIKLPAPTYDPWLKQIPYSFFFGLQACLNVAGFAAAIKLMKHWYEKEYRNNILQKEKLDAELQSLKAQLHPHFLFNTLNNIYSITENTSPLASGMLLKLSALLRYILYDCDRPLVPLFQEFRLIEDYISLEKIRYTHLDLTAHLPVDSDHYTIAPLLLLPLVENCFKHGTSRVIEQPWIRIDAELKDDWLFVKLINGRPTGEGGDNFTEGIGLSNVRKRLQLLYPNKHELSIISEQDLFIVNFKVELQTSNPDGARSAQSNYAANG